MATGYDAYPRPPHATAAPTRAKGWPIVVGTCGTRDSNGAIRLAHLLVQRNARAVYVVGVLDTDWQSTYGTGEGSEPYDPGRRRHCSLASSVSSSSSGYRQDTGRSASSGANALARWGTSQATTAHRSFWLA